MAGSGAIKRKSIQKRLREIRAQAVQELTWVAWPAWFIGGEVDCLLPVEDIDLSTITQAVYLEAIEEAVAAGELRKDSLEAAWQERSWARFVAWREGDHGPHIDAAKQPVAPQQPAATTVETYGHEGGTNRRSSPETPEVEDRWEQERLRLLAIANASPIRYFT